MADFKKYSWDDFFDFNEDTPLNEFSSGIERLEKTYLGMANGISKSNDRIRDSQFKLVDEAKMILRSIESLNTAQKDSSEVMAKSATATGSLTAEMKALRDIEAANAKQIKELQAQIVALNKAKADSKKVLDGETGSLRDLKKQLGEAALAYEKMGNATDAAVKDEQLKRVSELAEQHKTAAKVLTDAKKSTTAVAGSYNELSQKVAAAKKELKTLEGAFDGTNPRVKELSTFVDEGTKKLKSFDSSISDNTRNVGNYQSAFDAIVPGFSNMTAGIEQATAASRAFLASPIGIVLAAVAAALALVATYFQRTDEGGDKLAEIIERVSAVFGVLLDVAAQGGKIIFDAISEPKKLFDELVESVESAGEALTKFFDDPVESIKAFGAVIQKHFVGVFQNFADAFSLLRKGEFTAAAKSFADGMIQFTTGIVDGTDKAKAALSGLMDSLKTADELGRQIAALQDEADSKRIENIKLRARTELQQLELSKRSKDKLRVADEERYQALRKEGELGAALLESELDVANKLLSIAQKRIQIRQLEGEVTDDLKEAEANALKEVLGLQAAASKAATKRQKDEIALVKEVETEMLARVKRERDAQMALDKFIIDERIRANNKIIEDENATLDEILEAIMRSGDDQQELFERQRDQQLAVAEEAAIARVELSEDTLSQIYNNETLSLHERIQQERDIKKQQLESDEAFINERTKIEGEYFSNLDQLNKRTADAAEHNIFKILARDAELLRDSTDTLIAEGLIDLNSEFEKGEVRLAEYYRRRESIQENGQRAQLESLLDYLEEEKRLFEQYGHDTTDLERQIAEARLGLSDQTANELLEREENLQSALAQLRDVAIETANSIVASQFEKEQMEYDEKLERLQERAELELQLAGDNEEKKTEIQHKFNQEQAKIESDRAKSARKQAVFEKASAIFTIGLNTAIAVGKAVAASPLTGGLPFSAIAAAIGALQIAAVLAKPIPTYAEGTDYHKGGLALFAEAGGEIVETPGGKMTYYDSPTVGDLPRGSKVYTAEQTTAMLNSNAMMAQSLGQYANDNDKLGGVGDVIAHDQHVAEMLSMKLDSLEHTIKSKKELHINITRAGVKKMINSNDDWTEYLNRNYF